MFRHKRVVTGIAMKQLTVAQLPFVALLTAAFSEPEPDDVEQRYDQQRREKNGKAYADHQLPPLRFQFIV